ncbi:unnamed protein product, partial [Acanthoscelides obtectus]
MNLGGNTPW